MGIEYKISFAPVATKAVDHILRSATHFTQTTEFNGVTNYEYRMPNNTGSMPSAQASIEVYGIYFCDFGNAGDIMAHIAQDISEQIGPPKIDELE